MYNFSFQGFGTIFWVTAVEERWSASHIFFMIRKVTHLYKA
jgi:hypothetical protein